jgi:hypothetical protein
MGAEVFETLGRLSSLPSRSTIKLAASFVKTPIFVNTGSVTRRPTARSRPSLRGATASNNS